MSRYKSWMPSKTADLVEMAQIWKTILKERTEDWRVEERTITELADVVEVVERELAVPKNEHTIVTRSRRRDSIEALKKVMRYVKIKHFFTPPLTNTDYVALLLRPKDTIPTPVNPPVMQAEANISFPAPGIISIKNIRPVGNVPDVRSGHGVRLYYGILARSDDSPPKKFALMKVPENGEDLPYSEFTRRNSFRLDVSSERGKVFYSCLRYENPKGQAGPWGKMTQVFIP